MKVGIAGGKGGTGKSTIAVNLAYILSEKYRVVLIDADVECPNDHFLLSVKLDKKKIVSIFKPEFNYKKCIRCGLCKSACAENAIVMFKEQYPFLLPNMCSGCTSCKLVCPVDAIIAGTRHIGAVYTTRVNANLTLVTGMLNEGQERTYPVVLETKKHGLGLDAELYIIDTSAGSGSHVAIALEDLDVVILVTEPTLVGVHDLEMILKLLKKQHMRGYVVINRADLSNLSMSYILEQYNAEKIGTLPMSKKLVDSYIKGVPISQLYPEDIAAKVIKELAVKIEQGIG